MPYLKGFIAGLIVATIYIIIWLLALDTVAQEKIESQMTATVKQSEMSECIEKICHYKFK